MPTTEDHDPDFVDLDRWPTIRAVEAMLDGQLAALAAVRATTGAIAAAADAAALRLAAGGRLVYSGAGTSGRVAVQDGVELGPTFGWPDTRLVHLLAGGIAALSHSAEGAEDDMPAARMAVAEAQVGHGDVVIGVAASGRTPFTLAVIDSARAAGALTIAVANNPGAPILAAAEYGLLAATGSEIIAGSTRMKAGTAQKAILNILSTTIMLRLGRVYRGLMVDMQISNEKLLARAQAMVASLAGCPEDVARCALEQTDGNIKAAVLVAMGKSPAEANARLAAHGGTLRAALDAALDADGEVPR
jgi:N-acetylmuramic acid 6-phosphate etherase